MTRASLPMMILVLSTACAHGLGGEPTPVDLRILPVLAGDPLEAAARDALAADPEGAEAAGLRLVEGNWSHHPTGEAHREVFLVANGRAALVAFVARLGEGALRLGEDEAILIGPVLGSPTEWRTFHVSNTGGMHVTAVRGAQVVDNPYGPPAVAVRLLPEDGEAFGALTARAVGRKIALVVDGEVTSAPVVQEAITGGRLQLTSEDDVEGLLRRLEGE